MNSTKLGVATGSPSPLAVSTECRSHGLPLGPSFDKSECYNTPFTPNILAHSFKTQSAHNDHQVSWNISIDHLPDGVLLEIFDTFRQGLQHERNCERVWNSNKGWFKLAHVCREWREVVLASPSRLHMRLVFTEHRSASASALKRLPALPIIVDYQSGRVTPLRRMVSALKYPNRVCGIAFTVPRTIPKELLAVMNQPFPALDSLELGCVALLTSTFLPPFLKVQPLHLRRLRFTGDASKFSCHILSYTTSSLVDLTLRLDRTLFFFETLLLPHIQSMPLLRRLKLELRGWLRPSETTSVPSSRAKDASLPKLNVLCFSGHVSQVGLMACLVAPSLQELRIAPYNRYSSRFQVPHLTKFVSNMGNSFSCTQLYASREGINLFVLTHTHPPFKLVVIPMTLREQMGVVFSATLATVEDVFLTSSLLHIHFSNVFSWCGLFAHFHSAKTLRISPGIETEVLDIFRRGAHSLNILPALEEIELNATMHPDTPTQIDEHRRAAVLRLFKPLVDERQEKGHTVNVHWNTDCVHPKYSYDSDTDM